MVQLRPLTLVALMVVPTFSVSAACAAGTAWSYERKLERISEERQVYMTLANSAVSMSDRSFNFALKYQETLSICMTKLYGRDTVELVQAANPKKGGIGGPLDVRKQSRLP
jgi:hypothetical protein